MQFHFFIYVVYCSIEIFHLYHAVWLNSTSFYDCPIQSIVVPDLCQLPAVPLQGCFMETSWSGISLTIFLALCDLGNILMPFLCTYAEAALGLLHSSEVRNENDMELQPVLTKFSYEANYQWGVSLIPHSYKIRLPNLQYLSLLD